MRDDRPFDPELVERLHRHVAVNAQLQAGQLQKGRAVLAPSITESGVVDSARLYAQLEEPDAQTCKWLMQAAHMGRDVSYSIW